MDGKEIVIRNVRHSTITVNNVMESSVEKIIRNFDLANATPIECQNFVRQLKQMSE